jgi:hypothetical protein
MLISQENIYSDLIKISNNGIYRNISVPLWIYNKIEESINFSSIPIIKNPDSSKFEVGHFGYFRIFIDLEMPYDQIHLFLEKDIIREYKIDSILESKQKLDGLLVAFIDKQ